MYFIYVYSYYVCFVFIGVLLSIRVFSFFFFKQKTAYEMRISDWSSDVCSSDLTDTAPWRLVPFVDKRNKAPWRGISVPIAATSTMNLGVRPTRDSDRKSVV